MRKYFYNVLFGSTLLIMSLAGCGGGGSSVTASGGGAGGAGGDGGGGGGGVVTASVTMDWEAPTVRADGTPLGDLSGFKVHYGTAPGNYSTSVDIGLATTCLIEDLPIGSTYFFVVTAYDASGNESELSNEISMDI